MREVPDHHEPAVPHSDERAGDHEPTLQPAHAGNHITANEAGDDTGYGEYDGGETAQSAELAQPVEPTGERRDAPDVAAHSEALEPAPISEPPYRPLGKYEAYEFTPVDEAMPIPRFTVPSDMPRLLRNNLYPAELGEATSGPDTPTTEKYFVHNHPGLLVRVTPNIRAQSHRAAKEATARLHGINVLPSEIIEAPTLQIEPFVVTPRINGVNLLDALGDNPSQRLLEEVDVVWKRLSDALVTANVRGAVVAAETERPEQYMLGKATHEFFTRLWLADTPTSTEAVSPHNPATLPDAYERTVLSLINNIARIETVTGRQLPTARQGALRALSLANDSARFGDGIIRVAQQVLNEGTVFYPTAEDLERLRTR